MFQNKMSDQKPNQEPATAVTDSPDASAKESVTAVTVGTPTAGASATPKVTSIEKNTKVGAKPKDPGRVAAGKKLAELNKKRHEEKKKSAELERQTHKPQESNNLEHQSVMSENTDAERQAAESSFFQNVSFNQIISAAGIIASLVGLYLKREELMSTFQTATAVTGTPGASAQNKSSSPRSSPRQSPTEETMTTTPGASAASQGVRTKTPESSRLSKINKME